VVVIILRKLCLPEPSVHHLLLRIRKCLLFKHRIWI